jgi:hypothetical protein
LSFCTFSFGHCVVCPFSIYGFWLPLLVSSNSSENTLITVFSFTLTFIYLQPLIIFNVYFLERRDYYSQLVSCILMLRTRHKANQNQETKQIFRWPFFQLRNCLLKRKW